MNSTQEAYAKAHEVDEVVNHHLTQASITPENATNWRLYVRTLQSTLDILTRELDRVEGKKLTSI